MCFTVVSITRIKLIKALQTITVSFEEEERVEVEEEEKKNLLSLQNKCPLIMAL